MLSVDQESQLKAKTKKDPSVAKRMWQRLPLAIPVFVHGQDEEGVQFTEFSTAMNISAGGATLAIRRYLRPAMKICLEIPSTAGVFRADTQLKTKLPATVLNRVANSGDERFHVIGVRFSQPLLYEESKPAAKKRTKKIK